MMIRILRIPVNNTHVLRIFNITCRHCRFATDYVTCQFEDRYSNICYFRLPFKKIYVSRTGRLKEEVRRFQYVRNVIGSSLKKYSTDTKRSVFRNRRI